MKFQRLDLRDGIGNDCSLSNICGYWPTASGVIDIEDAIEDATDAEDVCKRLGKLDLQWKTWSVNRETDSCIRLLHIDGFGNRQYLIITK